MYNGVQEHAITPDVAEYKQTPLFKHGLIPVGQAVKFSGVVVVVVVEIVVVDVVVVVVVLVVVVVVVVVVEVVVVGAVVVVRVVVVGATCWQYRPENPVGQLQNPKLLNWKQAPPFRQGLGEHKFLRVVETGVVLDVETVEVVTAVPDSQ